MQPALSSKPISRKNNRTKIILLAILGFFAIFSISVILWFISVIGLPKDSKNTNQVIFTANPNTSIERIANDLLGQGLIKDKNAFIIYAKFGPARGNLKPGVYMFSPSMSIAKISDMMGGGKIATEKITFQEGLTINEMAKKWAKAGFGDAQSFVDVSKLKDTYSQGFLQYRNNKDSLEGYLFPDTYSVLINTTPQEQINTMLDRFQSQVIPKLPQQYQNPSSLGELITLASIVEKEANTTEDRKKVASVFVNRLKAGMKLESDVTVNYATGKTQTSPSDLNINSPYNTYLVKGLPYGPICNPSLDAILATANLESTDYLFFIADKQGTVHFARTLEEHNKNIEIYLNR